MTHPMAFQKTSSVVTTKGGKKERPDVEDAIEESDEEEVSEEGVAEDEDLTKDKLILAKKPKGKPKGKPKAATKTTGKTKAQK
jgi:replication factor C subunit 1